MQSRATEAHAKDEAGHGTHITTILAGTNISDNGNPHGVAPNVKLINVKALREERQWQLRRCDPGPGLDS